MNTIKLNIGLENNPYGFHDLFSIVSLYFPEDRLYSRQQIGEYNGEPERTAVILISSSEENESSIIESIEQLTELFTQDCIAVKINDVGYLVYNPEYKGEKLEFNNEYFIEP